MKLIEIGASYNPIVAKRDGWLTTVVDHTDREALVRKYSSEGLGAEAIEEVDIVWSGGDLAAAFPAEALGGYDAILASHVMEHMPDPISFLIAAQKLLKPDGRVLLALPDLRYMFDLFQPLTTTPDWLVAHDNRARTHSRRAAFNHVAYNVANGAEITWHRARRLRALRLTAGLRDAASHFDLNTELGNGQHYHDYHAWHFTPSSFCLLMMETAILRDVDFAVTDCSRTIGHEFFVTLSRGLRVIDDSALETARIRLLKASAREVRSGVRWVN